MWVGGRDTSRVAITAEPTSKTNSVKWSATAAARPFRLSGLLIGNPGVARIGSGQRTDIEAVDPG